MVLRALFTVLLVPGIVWSQSQSPELNPGFLTLECGGFIEASQALIACGAIDRQGWIWG